MMNDASIIQMFLDRNEDAIHEVDLKYGKLCLRLANNILMCKEDAEEVLVDTYLKIWNTIPEDRPDNLTAYICKIVKRLSLDKRRYKNAQKRNDEASVSIDELAEILSDQKNPEDDLIIRDLSDSISNFLLKENKTNRQLFIRRYWYYDPIESIAEQFEMNPKTVTTILFRIRKRLKKYLEKEGYDL